jgi:hypothetical protein
MKFSIFAKIQVEDFFYLYFFISDLSGKRENDAGQVKGRERRDDSRMI